MNMVKLAVKNAHKTAITRKKLSRPMQFLLSTGRLCGDCLDFGCGKGFDADALGIPGYDPHYRKIELDQRFDTIACNFVLNVLPVVEQRKVVDHIDSLLVRYGIAYLTVRNDRDQLNGFTRRCTYQCQVKLDLFVVEKNAGFKIYKLQKGEPVAWLD